MLRIVLVISFFVLCIVPLPAATPADANSATSSVTSATTVRARISAAIERRSRVPLNAEQLKADNASLREELATLRNALADTVANEQHAARLIRELSAQLERAESDAQALLSAELDKERARLAAYMAASDARLAELKGNMQGIAADVAAVERGARVAIARGIVKSRQHRAALRTVASLKEALSLSQTADTNVAVRSREVVTSGSTTVLQATTKPRAVREARRRNARESGIPQPLLPLDP